ncbi:MAG: uroporphyrinogen-III synthase [Pseudomonadota bacterium]
MAGAPRLALVTRPEPQASESVTALAGLGVAALACPLTEIVPASPQPALPEGTEALAFTSANAVRAVAAAPWFAGALGLRAYCVGSRTAAVARAAGFERVDSAAGDAAALATALRHAPERHIFHPHGREVTGDLAAALAGSGRLLTGAVAYAAEARRRLPDPALEALEARRIGVLGLWSRRNAVLFAGFAARNRGWELGRIRAVAISPAAAEPLGPLGLGTIAVASAPDGAAMHATIARLSAESDAI